MSDVKRVFKWWWAWSHDRIENWLEEMEAQGWNLFHVDCIAVRFHFTKGKSRRMRYCTDYQPKIDPEYKNVFFDAGWELVYSENGWYIWRMEYQGTRPEAYSDVDSLIERNKRFIWIISMLCIVVPLQLIMSTIAVNDSHRLPDLIRFRYGAMAALIAFEGYMLIKFLQFDKALKRKKQLKK